MWKTIHALLNLDIYSVIVCNVSGVIFIDNLLVCDAKGNLHVFVTVHCCVEIKIDIPAHKNMALSVEMVLFMRVLSVIVSDVGFVTLSV